MGLFNKITGKFWDDVKQAREGHKSKFCVRLGARFALEQGNSVDPDWKIESVQAFLDQDGIVILPEGDTPSHQLGWMDQGLVKAYWLPWQRREVKVILLSEMSDPNVDFFITSEFSGCRFVVTDKYIGHVAYSAGPRFLSRPTNILNRRGSSVERTLAEEELLQMYRLSTPEWHRSISYGDLSTAHAPGFGSSDTKMLSYLKKGSMKGDRMIVFGYRDPASCIGWNFKYLTFNCMKKEKPIWHIIPLPNTVPSVRFQAGEDTSKGGFWGCFKDTFRKRK